MENGGKYMALTSIDFDKIILDTIDTVTAYDKADGSILLMLDQLKDGTIEQTSETVYGTGKAGVRLSALDRNKGAKFSCNNGYVIASAISAQVGADIEDASVTSSFAVPHIQFVKVTSAMDVVLEYDVVGELGKEIPFIYKSNSDNTQGEKFPIAAEASATAFSFDPATKTITLPTGVFAKDDIIIVPYDRKAFVAKKLVNNGDKFSKTARIVLDITGREVCDQSKVYHVIMEYGNAKIDGNFTLTLGNEPAVQAFSAEAMQDICSTDSKKLWTMYIV